MTCLLSSMTFLFIWTLSIDATPWKLSYVFFFHVSSSSVELFLPYRIERTSLIFMPLMRWLISSTSHMSTGFFLITFVLYSFNYFIFILWTLVQNNVLFYLFEKNSRHAHDNLYLSYKHPLISSRIMDIIRITFDMTSLGWHLYISSVVWYLFPFLNIVFLIVYLIS